MLKPAVRRFPNNSVAHLAYPLSRRYDLRVAHQGKLNEESTKILVKVFRELMQDD